MGVGGSFRGVGMVRFIGSSLTVYLVGVEGVLASDELLRRRKKSITVMTLQIPKVMRMV